MKLSYSDYRTYLDCPRLYKLRIDKVVPPEKESKYFALYGLLVEAFFKYFTNEVLKKARVLVEAEVREILWSMWQDILQRNYVNWEDPWVKSTSDQIFEMAYVDVLENMAKFSFWKNARSEVSFQIKLKKSGDIMTCRMDFLCEPLQGPIEILDGKGKMKIDKSIDVEQLYFYALMYLLTRGRLPDKVGFLYYRFKLIKYMDFDQSSIMSFRDKLAVVKRTIKADKEFLPNVGLSKQCRWCPYKSGCDQYLLKKDKPSSIPKLNEKTGTYIDLEL